MNDQMIYVSSVTQAMRGQAVLQKHGIRCDVHRQTGPAQHGCGYYLLLRSGGRGDAEALLRQAGVRVLTVP
ncbi:MAG: DUF3343 domain-containing protein [Clostridia bacterium]|nr:DUF3343 domain-containing protein [Clostridia bacterium]